MKRVFPAFFMTFVVSSSAKRHKQMHFNKVHHIAIIVSDYQASQKFYTQILPFEVIKETYRKERNSYKLDLSLNGQYQLELFSFPGAPPRPSFPEAIGLRHLAFEVDDVAGTKAVLEEKGVAVQDIRVDEITGKKFAFFEDPDGLPLEIYQQ